MTPALPAAPPARKPLFLGLSVRLLLGFTLIFSVVFAAAFAWFYDFSTRSALDHIREHLNVVIQGTVQGINGDDFEVLAKQPRRAEGQPPPTAEYLAHQEWLRVVHQLEPRAIPYTFVASGKGKEVLWIGDVFRAVEPNRASTFKEAYDASGSMLYGGLDKLVVNMTPYTDKWGSWVSAYRPILNKEGRIVGGVGVDFSANHVYQVQNAIRDQMWRAFAITYAALFLLVAIFSRAFTRPLERLTHLARRVGDGQYDVDFGAFSRGRLQDEISALGQVLGTTVEKVREREQSLRREVQELRIEIDQSKKERQVQEIVETDFFRDLKSKAQGMRSRARDRDDGPQPGTPSTDASSSS